jgi:hypothetical protein
MISVQEGGGMASENFRQCHFDHRQKILTSFSLLIPASGQLL